MTVIRVTVREDRDASYDVTVGRGALAALPAVLQGACPAERYAVIADHHVADLHAPALRAALAAAGIATSMHTFPAGEWNKSRATWSELSDALLAERLGRDGAIIAFGGGVAGDLAGFVAATYLRGVPYVQVPTSLLAMIDSSIGGKTGVDTPAGKNLVGAFHQPRAVVADVDLLATLAKPQLSAGAAEAVKHGVVADADYVGTLGDATVVLDRDLDALERLVSRSIAIKAEVVRRDEREAGLRAILNFGHTIGHAVEACAGFELLHGEAVAIGMVAELALGEAIGVSPAGLAGSVRALLESYRLPVLVPAEFAWDDLLAAMQSDKKSRGGTLRFALPRAMGAMHQSPDGEWTVPVDVETVARVIASLRD